MNRFSTAAAEFSLVFGFALGAILVASPGAAATIVVPSVTVTQLDLGFISIPGPGYTVSGFSAMISTGDVVKVRIQASPGKMFVVHTPSCDLGCDVPSDFYLCVYWNSAPTGTISSEEPHTVTFENLQGPPPIQTWSLTTLGDDRQIVQVWKQYQFTTGFRFTAVDIDITAALPHAPVERSYSNFGAWQIPSFGARDMEMVDIATPARPTSWGKIKALYR